MWHRHGATGADLKKKVEEIQKAAPTDGIAQITDLDPLKPEQYRGEAYQP